MKPQTGVMQFERDRPGIFIRGEDAASWSEHLRQAAELASVSNGKICATDVGRLRHLSDLLATCQSPPAQKAQLVISHSESPAELAAAAGKAQG